MLFRSVKAQVLPQLLLLLLPLLELTESSSLPLVRSALDVPIPTITFCSILLFHAPILTLPHIASACHSAPNNVTLSAQNTTATPLHSTGSKPATVHHVMSVERERRSVR